MVKQQLHSSLHIGFPVLPTMLHQWMV